jgi:formylglycine-generating enzyme required for sulfatase activity
MRIFVGVTVWVPRTDMAGNVQQWVEDCNHANYDEAPTNGAAWLRGDCRSRMVRGGSSRNPPPRLRSATRGRHTDSWLNIVGFRLGRTLSP